MVLLKLVPDQTCNYRSGKRQYENPQSHRYSFLIAEAVTAQKP